VSGAFLAVPRHVFLPRELAAEAYEDTADEGSPGITVYGYGPGGAALAARLADRAAVWDGLGRPGAASLELNVHPAGTRPETGDGRVIIRRPSSVLVAGWPTSASR
jgi:hypothetical protein